MQTKLIFKQSRRPWTSRKVNKSTVASALESDAFDLDPLQILDSMDWDKFLDEKPAPCLGAFSAREDMLLLDAVQRRENRGWAWVSSQVPGRIGKQVRERWCNHLDPSLAKGKLTPEELQFVLQLVAKHGRRWSHIAREVSDWRVNNGLSGRRADNQIKNACISHFARHKAGKPAKTSDVDAPGIVPRAALQKGKLLFTTVQQPNAPPPRTSRFVFGERNDFRELNKRLCVQALRVMPV